MSKIAIIGDTHWGIRGDSLVFLNHFKKFFDEIFFPTLFERGITEVIHLGDLVDRRKFINYNTARRLRIDFLEKFDRHGIKLTVIAGNHDTFFKNTNNMNNFDELIGGKYHNIVYLTEPEERNIHNKRFLFLPWICNDNRQKSMEMINASKCRVAFGHLELAGFEYYRGHVAEDGDDPKLFDKFDFVFSGHYHTKSNNSNIHYLGTPCEYMWSDYMDPKGFHIFDTVTNDLEYIRNNNNIFHKIFYDDTITKFIDTVDFTLYKDTYVKLIIKTKNDIEKFDKFIAVLEKSGVQDLQIIEDYEIEDLESEEHIISESEDTVSILQKHINQNNFYEKNKLEKFIIGLYHEALLMEV